MREGGFRTGVVIGALVAAVVALGVALILTAGGDDSEPETTTSVATTVVTTTTASPTTTQPTGGATASCGPISGGLSDNVFNIQAVGTQCPEAHAVIGGWFDNSCGAKTVGEPCDISGGYTCVTEKLNNVEGASIACRSAHESVFFDTGA